MYDDFNDPTVGADTSFVGPQLQTTVPMPSPAPQPAGFHRALQVALPLIAAAFAAKSGGLGGFGMGYGNTALALERLRQTKQEQDLQHSIQAEGLRVRQDAERRQQQRDQQAAADRDAAFKEKQLKDRQDLYRKALDSAIEANPKFMDKVNEGRPESFAITVPSIGNVSLKDMLDTLGAPTVEGKRVYGIKKSDGPLYEVNENGKGVFRNRQDAEGKPKYEKPPKEPSPQPQMWFDDKGKPHAIQFVGGKATEIPLPSNLVGKSIQAVTRKDVQTKAQQTFDSLESNIDEADRRGLLGPMQGRISDLLAGKVGSTGDEANDVLLGQLRADFNLAKIQTDTVLGGARGGASPQLAKRWDDILNTKISKAGLKGAIASMRRLTADLADAQQAAPNAGGGPKVEKWIRDGNGNLVKAGSQ